MADAHLRGRAYNGLTGHEVKTLVLQQLSSELKKQRDPFPEWNWRKTMAQQIDHELSLDNAYAMHITYPVVEWAFELHIEADEEAVEFFFELKLSAYPVHTAETSTKVNGRIMPRDPQGNPIKVPGFTQTVKYGQEYEAPDTLRRKAGLPVAGAQAGDGGRVDLTAKQVDEQVAGPRKALETF